MYFSANGDRFRKGGGGLAINTKTFALCVCVFCVCLQANLTHIPRSEYVPGIGLGIAKCPYDPQDNSTAIYVESGNPGGLPALVSAFM